MQREADQLNWLIEFHECFVQPTRILFLFAAVLHVGCNVLLGHYPVEPLQHQIVLVFHQCGGYRTSRTIYSTSRTRPCRWRQEQFRDAGPGYAPDSRSYPSITLLMAVKDSAHFTSLR